jgi:hypothetical protein
MSYDRYRFTYGIKTTNEIASISGIAEGQSVWNSDLKKPEYVVNVGGNLLWSNDDCIIMLNTSGSPMEEGNIVRITTSTTSPTTLGCVLANAGTTQDDLMFGVVLRGAATNNYIVVAQQGMYKVKMITSATTGRGDLVSLSSTLGRGTRTSGTAPGTTSGVIAVMMQTFTNAQLASNNYLCSCMIQNFAAF